jgi:hypothetical protein
MVLFWYSKSTISYTICIHQLEVIFTRWRHKHYSICNKTITDFCISEYEFLLTCKTNIDLSLRLQSILFYRSIKTHIHFYKSLCLYTESIFSHSPKMTLHSFLVFLFPLPNDLPIAKKILHVNPMDMISDSCINSNISSGYLSMHCFGWMWDLDR